MNVADLLGSAFVTDETADVSPSMVEMDDVFGPVQFAAARDALERTLHMGCDMALGEPITIAGNKARNEEAVFVRTTCIGRAWAARSDR